MKKLLLSLLCASGLAYGQQIPNGDFENWSTSLGSPYPSPTGFFSSGITDTALTKVPGYQGGYAVHLTNGDLGFDTIFTALSGGYFQPHGLPSKLSGYYRCNMRGLDSASIMLILGDRRKAINQDDASAFAYMNFGGVHSDWTYFEAPVTLLTNDPIDTGGVIMSSDAVIYGNPDLHDVIQPGSYIEFDKLTVVYGQLGLLSPTISSSLKVYPNPASQSITLENRDGLKEYTIQDLSGATVLKGTLKSGSNAIDLSAVAPGTYVVLSRSESRTFSSKLVVK